MIEQLVKHPSVMFFPTIVFSLFNVQAQAQKVKGSPESSNFISKSAPSVDYNWKVKDLSGKEISLSQFKGR